MRALDDDLSGAWSGWSVQDAIRITEAMTVTVRGGAISGVGSDKDGDFEIVGSYQIRSQRVALTRRYSWTTEPSQQFVGIPYDYDGVWDGAMISGFWHPRSEPAYGGPFEMWPDRGEDGLNLAELVEEFETSATRSL